MSGDSSFSRVTILPTRRSRLFADARHDALHASCITTHGIVSRDCLTMNHATRIAVACYNEGGLELLDAIGLADGELVESTRDTE